MKKNLERKGSLLGSKSQRTLNQKRADLFINSISPIDDKLNSFTPYVSRQNIAKLIAQLEMVRLTSGILGDIVEIGLLWLWVNGLGNMVTSLEPYNYQCQIIGFDTFTGSKGVSQKIKFIIK